MAIEEHDRIAATLVRDICRGADFISCSLLRRRLVPKIARELAEAERRGGDTGA